MRAILAVNNIQPGTTSGIGENEKKNSPRLGIEPGSRDSEPNPVSSAPQKTSLMSMVKIGHLTLSTSNSPK